MALFESVEDTSAKLAAVGYLADPELSVTVYLATRMQRPLLVEGEPGVGKTELAKALSRVAGGELIRLQCYEGLDLNQAAYEWNYPRQLLEIAARQSPQRAAASAAEALGPSASGPNGPQRDGARVPLRELYTEEYLLKRPLLRALGEHARPPVLLIDELDRADEEFESFLLEVLGEFQITIPELGTVRAVQRPLVVLTSNRTREIHDALKRRCLYHWLDYPTFEAEVAILTRHLPELSRRLSEQIAGFTQALRRSDLYKPPGLSESIDWAHALSHLGSRALTHRDVLHSAGCLLKHRDDLERLRGGLAEALLGGGEEAATTQAVGTTRTSGPGRGPGV